MSRHYEILLVALCVCWLSAEVSSSPHANAVPAENSCPVFLSSRIIEGKIAPDGAFPYQVSIRKHGKHSCGGSIINKRWILTAAHCLNRTVADALTIVAGSNKINHGGTAYGAVKIICHPKYSIVNVINDVGLIKLDSDIEFGENVKPVELPTNDVDYDDHSAVIAGWGIYEKNSFLISQNLRYFTTCLLSKSRCSKQIPVVNEYQKICSFTRYGQGACNGDSGSPLTVNGKQVGIASYVISYCANGYPDFFTRVYSYLDWINQEMANDS